MGKSSVRWTQKIEAVDKATKSEAHLLRTAIDFFFNKVGNAANKCIFGVSNVIGGRF